MYSIYIARKEHECSEPSKLNTFETHANTHFIEGLTSEGIREVLLHFALHHILEYTHQGVIHTPTNTPTHPQTYTQTQRHTHTYKHTHTHTHTPNTYT